MLLLCSVPFLSYVLAILVYAIIGTFSEDRLTGTILPMYTLIFNTLATYAFFRWAVKKLKKFLTLFPFSPILNKDREIWRLKKMDAITHTLLAWACMGQGVTSGEGYLSKMDILENVVDTMFRTLEKDGFYRDC